MKYIEWDWKALIKYLASRQVFYLMQTDEQSCVVLILKLRNACNRSDERFVKVHFQSLSKVCCILTFGETAFPQHRKMNNRVIFQYSNYIVDDIACKWMFYGR